MPSHLLSAPSLQGRTQDHQSGTDAKTRGHWGKAASRAPRVPLWGRSQPLSPHIHPYSEANGGLFYRILGLWVSTA